MFCATQSKATFLLLPNIQSLTKSFVSTEQSLASAMLSRGFPLKSEALCGKTIPHASTGTQTSAWTECTSSSREATGCMYSGFKHSSTRVTLSFVFCLFFLYNHHKPALCNYRKQQHTIRQKCRRSAVLGKRKTTVITQ